MGCKLSMTKNGEEKDGRPLFRLDVNYDIL